MVKRANMMVDHLFDFYFSRLPGRLKQTLFPMHIRLPGKSGIEATHEITQQWPDAKVI
jgi:hypothetical protein